MISVIVPVYNGEKTICSCLGSILAQKGATLEALVIDDGSTDKTAALCRRMAERDSRIRFFRQSNGGVSAARNLGLSKARGTFVTFVDADDTLPPGALATLREAGEQEDLIIGSVTYHRFLWRRKAVRRETDSLPTLMSLIGGKLYRRDRVGELRFREDLPYGEDTVFNLQYAAAAKPWQVLPRSVYRCRMGGTASSCRYYPDRDRIARELVEAYRAFGVEVTEIARREWEETVLHYFLHCPDPEARALAQRAGILLKEYLPEGLSVERVLRKNRLRLWLRRRKKQVRRLLCAHRDRNAL